MNFSCSFFFSLPERIKFVISFPRYSRASPISIKVLRILGFAKYTPSSWRRIVEDILHSRLGVCQRDLNSLRSEGDQLGQVRLARVSSAAVFVWATALSVLSSSSYLLSNKRCCSI